MYVGVTYSAVLQVEGDVVLPGQVPLDRDLLEALVLRALPRPRHGLVRVRHLTIMRNRGQKLVFGSLSYDCM